MARGAPSRHPQIDTRTASSPREPSTRVRYRSPCRLWYPRTSCTSTLNGLTIPRQSCPPVLPWLPGVFSTPTAGRPLLRPRAPGAAPTRPDLRVGASSKRRRVCLGAAHPAVHGTVRMDRLFFTTNAPTCGRVGAFAGGAEHTLSAASPRVVTQPPPACCTPRGVWRPATRACLLGLQAIVRHEEAWGSVGTLVAAGSGHAAGV